MKKMMHYIQLSVNYCAPSAIQNQNVDFKINDNYPNTKGLLVSMNLLTNKNYEKCFSKDFKIGNKIK
jgi:hypothetical protein